MLRYICLFTCYLLTTQINGQTALEYNLRKGDVFTIKQESVQQTSRELTDITQILTTKMTSVLDFVVLDEDLGAFELQVTFKALEMTLNSNLEGTLFHVNADDIADDNTQSKIFHSLLNVPIGITMNKMGNVIRVTGGRNLVDKMVDAAGLIDELDREQLLHSIEKDFGQEALAATFEQMTFIYPGTMIKIGDSWDNQYKGDMDISTRWTLTGLVNGLAKIEGKAQVLVDIHEPEATMMLQGNRATELTADLSTGFIRTMKVTDISRGNTTLPGWEQGLIPTIIQATTTYKRI